MSLPLSTICLRILSARGVCTLLYIAISSHCKIPCQLYSVIDENPPSVVKIKMSTGISPNLSPTPDPHDDSPSRSIVTVIPSLTLARPYLFAMTPLLHSKSDTKSLLIPPSHEPNERNDREAGRSQISQSGQTTIKPRSLISEATLRPDMFLSSYQQMLQNLPPTTIASSLGLVRSTNERARKVDELDVEVCFQCREERSQSQVVLKEVDGWGEQWVCQYECEERNKSVIGQDETGKAGEQVREKLDQ